MNIVTKAGLERVWANCKAYFAKSLSISGNAVTLKDANGNALSSITLPSADITATSSGSGNAVTSITASNGALTVTKGSTFLTSHQDISGKADKASITAGSAGTSSATSGASLAVPYVTVDAQGIVTGYGTHTHTITGFSTLTDTNFNGAEVVYNNGSSGTIVLSNGRIFYTTATSITLPTVVAGVTVTIITNASAITWGGATRVWSGGTAPVLSTGTYQVFTFVGINTPVTAWFGTYGGAFS